jgi:hypothetical protein
MVNGQWSIFNLQKPNRQSSTRIPNLPIFLKVVQCQQPQTVIGLPVVAQCQNIVPSGDVFFLCGDAEIGYAEVAEDKRSLAI